MKQLLGISLLAAALVGCGAVPATPDGAPASRHLERMQAELGLTAAQASQINAIEQAQRNRMDYLRNSSQARIRAC
ncbi:MAG: periplasmic heavy metal sensor [Candidatus Thiothrix singaporensis]|uniref:Periplasmic heavy metal sensor n=1 Tax=Candidatus Thiothrix singaporensis TaxID=2799669 RepID=A0A7L6AU87_9GAMM|nr:MAG: periplasmic heavy metal sensor [Candidatus Thiothrix singaporensis]